MKLFPILLSAITSFIITGGGALGVVLAAGGKLNEVAWIASVTLGAVSAAKDVRSMMQLPPLSNGNYATLARLYERVDTADRNKGKDI